MFICTLILRFYKKVLILLGFSFVLLLMLLLYYAERLLFSLALIKNRCFLSLSEQPTEMTTERTVFTSGTPT